MGMPSTVGPSTRILASSKTTMNVTGAPSRTQRVRADHPAPTPTARAARSVTMASAVVTGPRGSSHPATAPANPTSSTPAAMRPGEPLRRVAVEWCAGMSMTSRLLGDHAWRCEVRLHLSGVLAERGNSVGGRRCRSGLNAFKGNDGRLQSDAPAAAPKRSHIRLERRRPIGTCQDAPCDVVLSTISKNASRSGVADLGESARHEAARAAFEQPDDQSVEPHLHRPLQELHLQVYSCVARCAMNCAQPDAHGCGTGRTGSASAVPSALRTL